MGPPAMASARALVAALAGGGVREAVVSPGSRSAPLAWALAEASDAGLLNLRVRIDERSAGFLALGLGKGLGMPAMVITTSGTAAANLLPAVLEAHHARVPLIALTADRPTDLRGVGASQTLDHQAELFGSAVRLAIDVPAPVGQAGELGQIRTLACRALAAATGTDGAEPGPVHLNLAFRPPLHPEIGSPPPPWDLATMARPPVAPLRPPNIWFDPTGSLPHGLLQFALQQPAVPDDPLAGPLTRAVVAREVAAATGPGDLLFIGPSSPIRELAVVLGQAAQRPPPAVLANRGLAGIDGCVSTAVGIALAHPTGTVRALLGDLTLLHDANGLLIGPTEQRPQLQIVVVNDHGGAIFASLPHGQVAASDPNRARQFERVLTTMPGVDLRALSAAYRVLYRHLSNLDELRAALAQPIATIELLEVPVARPVLD